MSRREGPYTLSRFSGLLYHEECAFLYAHAGISADPLVMESPGVSGLQAGVLQRILHTFQVDAGGRTWEGEDRNAILRISLYRPEAGLDHENPPSVCHDRGTQAYALGGEQDLWNRKEGP